MQLNKIVYIDLADPLPKSYAPKKGEEMNRSTYSTMLYKDERRENIRSNEQGSNLLRNRETQSVR